MPPERFHEEDPFAPVQYSYDVDAVVCRRRTRHQDLMIFDNAYWGRVLVLDGVVQLTERDEYFYHEMLAHVPAHAHPAPADVVIVGGGDGGTLREILKHSCVQRAVLVELDLGVVEASKEFLPTLSSGFSDPRVEVVEMDGVEYLAAARGQFDLAIVDSTDPVGPAEALFGSPFFESAFSALKPEGMFVAQTESLHFHRDFVRDVQRRLTQVFPVVRLYTVPVATYAGNWWTFSIASRAHDPGEPRRKLEVATRYYAEDVHRHAFLPQSVYTRLMAGD